MQTTVTERGQISIPSAIRRQFNLEPGMGVEWLVLPEGIFLHPVPKDPIKAFRGSGRGKAMSRFLLEERRKDKEREERKWKIMFSTRRRSSP